CRRNPSSAPLPFAYCVRLGEEERDVLSAGAATHFRHRHKFNLNAAGFVPMRSVALTLRRVAQMASFENGMKVALKIMPPRGFIPTYLGPPRLSPFVFWVKGERSTFRLGNAPMWPALDSCVRLSALPHAAMALPLDLPPPKGRLRGEYSEQIAPP